jgi:hypothetical protein
MFRFLEDISPNQHLLAAGLGLPLFAALLTSLLRTTEYPRERTGTPLGTGF